MNTQFDLVSGMNDLNLRDEIDKDFKNISNILFHINNKHINLTSYIINGESYFKAKDVLKHLGYVIDKNSIRNKFNEIININNNYCMKLEKILCIVDFNISQNLNYKIKKKNLSIYLKK